MFQPSFDRGNILKQHMLEALRDCPVIVLDVLFSEYADGIISGFEISAADGETFKISPGILKFNGTIYVSSEEIIIHQENEVHFVYLSIHKTENADGVDVELTCEQSENMEENKFELFRYTKNAEVRKYDNASELLDKSPINRINQVYCKYSIKGGSTLHPDYFKLFAQEVLDRPNALMSDVAFAYQCLSGIFNVDIINQYFGCNGGNLEILERMKKVLDRMSKSEAISTEEKEKVEAPRKMIIS